jgi:Ca-activated chloride channel family protein
VKGRLTPLSLLVLVLLLVAATSVPPAAAASRRERKETQEKIAQLPAAYQTWLEEHDLLMNEGELAAFLALEEDYQRDAFIQSFWKSRDPYPETGRNELQDRWQATVEEARSLFGDLRDERSRMMLLNGAPAARVEIGCSQVLYPSEVWFYDKGSRAREEIFLLFTRPFGLGAYRLWMPGDGIAALMANVGAASAGPRNTDSAAVDAIRSGCGQTADALFAALSNITKLGVMGYPLVVMKLSAPIASKSGEWLASFASYSTDLPAQAATFPAEVSFAYPGKRQSRTVAQGTVKVLTSALGQAEIAGSRSYNVVVTGEVLRGDELFDRFRYKFDFPASTVGEHLPLVFQRLLRPGDYRLVVKVEDLNGKRFYRSVTEVVVPTVENALAEPPADPETAALLAEANALLALGETSVKLLRPVGRDILAGKVRFDALVVGEQVAEVTFALDGQPILKKRTPPWSVELDLGNLPRSQTLSATARNDAGVAVASDELVLNASSHRFRVRVTSPLRGQRFEQSVRVVADVEVPEGEHVERLEIFLDETLVATLYQPPYEQPVVLTGGGEIAILRAVAYLPDGATSEDQVFINAPEGLEELDVQLVELYTSVLDKQGRPVDDLAETDFTVVEDGVPQAIVRFERVRDLPIKAGVLLDVSASMEGRLEQAQQAALSFFTETIGPRDRAALITFNDRPQLVVKLTNELLELGGGLAGLKAERGTALYDSIVFSLYYFNGLSGQRALIVLSDGKDESSRFQFDDALDFARRAGVTIFTIGLGFERGDHEAKKALEKLSEETGGRTWFVEDAGELVTIYQAIEEELRSQYLLVYQSTNTKMDKKFRNVDLKVARSGLDANTIQGYFP